MTAVNAANSNIDWSKFSNKIGGTLAQCTGNEKLGKYSSYIGNVLNGDTGAIADGAANEVISNIAGDNQVLGTALSTAYDVGKCVAQVLSGTYKMGADKAATAQAKSDVANTSSQTQSLSKGSENEAKSESDAIQSSIDANKQVIDGYNDSQKTALEKHIDLKDQVKQENDEIKEKANEKNKEIKQKQDRMEVIKEKLNSSKTDSPSGTGKAKQKQPAKAPAKQKPVTNPVKASKPGVNNAPKTTGSPAPTTTEPTDNSSSQFTPVSSNGENSQLVEEYNSLGKEVEADAKEVNSDQQKVAENNEKVESSTEETTAVTQEASDNIDAQTQNIMDMYGEGKEAINEIQNVLKGEFPKLDKVMVIKLAGEVAKAAINGTESGLLAAAASAMGVGSVFSFGSTAEKAAKLAAASADKAAGSTARLATNVAGKILEQQAMNIAKTALGNIPGIGNQLNEFFDYAMQAIQQGNQEVSDLRNEAEIEDSEDSSKDNGDVNDGNTSNTSAASSNSNSGAVSESSSSGGSGSDSGSDKDKGSDESAAA